jgi:hypothetical protein
LTLLQSIVPFAGSGTAGSARHHPAHHRHSALAAATFLTAAPAFATLTGIAARAGPWFGQDQTALGSPLPQLGALLPPKLLPLFRRCLLHLAAEACALLPGHQFSPGDRALTSIRRSLLAARSRWGSCCLLRQGRARKGHGQGQGQSRNRGGIMKTLHRILHVVISPKVAARRWFRLNGIFSGSAPAPWTLEHGRLVGWFPSVPLNMSSTSLALWITQGRSWLVRVG